MLLPVVVVPTSLSIETLKATEIKDLLVLATKHQVKFRSNQGQNQNKGVFASKYRGNGLQFSGIRPYEYGDDIKTLDWKITAKTGKPYIKLFEEERSLSYLIICDISPSMQLSHKGASKFKVLTEIVAVLSYQLLKRKFPTGLLCFHDKIACYLKPQSRTHQLMTTLHELLKNHDTDQNTITSLSTLAHFATQNKLKHVRPIIISDFAFSIDYKALKGFNYSLKPIYIALNELEDTGDLDLGILEYLNPESLKVATITQGKAVSQTINYNELKTAKTLEQTFKKFNFNHIQVNVKAPNYLQQLFNNMYV